MTGNIPAVNGTGTNFLEVDGNVSGSLPTGSVPIYYSFDITTNGGDSATYDIFLRLNYTNGNGFNTYSDDVLNVTGQQQGEIVATGFSSAYSLSSYQMDLYLGCYNQTQCGATASVPVDSSVDLNSATPLTPPAGTPEPASGALFTGAAAVLYLYSRRRKQKASE